MIPTVILVCILIQITIAESGKEEKKYGYFRKSIGTNEDEVRKMFGYFKSRFAKDYSNTQHEETRFGYFRSTLEKIKELKKLYPNSEFEPGKFADWSAEEVQKLRPRHKFNHSTDPQFTYFKSALGDNKYEYFKAEPLPEEVDWRTQGHVTAVKDQGNCGACWAFTAAAAIESLYSISGYERFSFSEQELVDCTQNTEGCEGGNSAEAFKYTTKNGIAFSSQYPYTAKTGKCKTETVTAPVSGFVLFRSELEIKQFVATNGTVSVGFKAPDSLLYYKSGIWDPSLAECAKTDFYHAVTIVGYGTDGNTDYWIAKNSWGVEWGEEGYMKMRRGVDACGLATEGLGQNSAPFLDTKDRPATLKDPRTSSAEKNSNTIFVWTLICFFFHNLIQS